MGFVQLLEVASMPVIQVLLVSALGAFMATQYFNNLLSPDFRKSLNKVTDSSSIKYINHFKYKVTLTYVHNTCSM